MDDKAFNTLQTVAFNGGPMPDGLVTSEQLLFLSLRSIYRDYRTGAIDKAQTQREKAETLRSYDTNAFSERMDAEMMDRIRRSEAVRHEIELGGCELCRRLVKILDGRD